jgi:DtxR family Mn-dependent transcriptional regulator
MGRVMVSHAIEDYLKAIYRLQQDGSAATTNAIAERVGVRAASVTSMLQQLSEHGLAQYTPYKGVYLTENGLALALRVIRRHRLIELYLHEKLGVPLERLHAEAERLEHAISPYLEERIDMALGYPNFDPHGDPIPSTLGEMPVRELIPLNELPTDTPGVVRHIPDDDPEVLRYVASLGLLPEARVTITRREPFDGPVSLRIAAPGGKPDNEQVVSAAMARLIYVSSPA